LLRFYKQAKPSITFSNFLNTIYIAETHNAFYSTHYRKISMYVE